MRTAILPLLPVLLLSLPAVGGVTQPAGIEEGTFSLHLSTWRPAQGDPVFVEASPVPHADNIVMTWKGKQFPMKEVEPGRFLGLIGVDLLEPPGKAPLSLRAQRGNEAFRIVAEIVVGKRAFPVQKLTLPKEMAQFDGPTLKRINREARNLAERFSRISSPPAWNIPFLPPVAQFQPKGFGARRIINGESRSPHAGVDVNLPAGTPVVAIADGTVAFSGEQFFAGNSVVLDHGGGVFSIYYHLQNYIVSEGQGVARGERIGAVGSTGRATGPHLHFSIRAAGGRIDPELLIPLPTR
jgi:murein DD-endopeptidase MepM/ murein hydrolase activator NlpD